MTRTGGPAIGARTPDTMRVSVMTPVVFCASEVPRAGETIEAEAIWPALKPFLTEVSSDRAVLR